MKTMSQLTETLLTGIDSSREQSNLKQQNTKEPLKRPQEDICGRTIQTSEEDKIKLTRLVTACYEGLNQFGRTPEQAESIIMLMQMTLGRFTYDTVRLAFSKYLQGNSAMPTPADIIKIIEPPREVRKWCATTFIDIKRRTRENQFITDEEKQYCRDFINAKITAPEEERGLIEDAILQVEKQDKQYWLE